MAELVLGTQEERDELIAICEAAIVPEKKWLDRDSHRSHQQLGELWALLRAGCDFHVHGADEDPASDGKTIWITTWAEGFQAFENGPEYRASQLHYLPTQARLKKAKGGDWY